MTDLTQSSGKAPSLESTLTDMRLVIFDFDGVIADSEILSLSILRQALAAFGIEHSSDEVRERFLGKSLQTIRDYVATESPKRTAKGFDDRWQNDLFEAFRASLKPVPHIKELLAHFNAIQMPYCIASSSTFQRLEVALTAMNLTEHFPHMFSAEQVRHGKPAPDLFLYAAEHMDVSPENCLVIEDSPYGVRAATSAGMQCFGFVGGKHLQGIAEKHAALLKLEGASDVISCHKRLMELRLKWNSLNQ